MYTCFMNDYIKEKLTSIRNEMNHIWSAMFLLGGSSLAFIAYEPNVLRIILGMFGIVFFCLLFNAYFIKRIELVKLISKYRE